MQNDDAPRPGCNCAVCTWCIERSVRSLGYQGYTRSMDEDLEANYQRYLAGDLVARDDRE